jgi:hypothetical protein
MKTVFGFETHLQKILSHLFIRVIGTISQRRSGKNHQKIAIAALKQFTQITDCFAAGKHAVFTYYRTTVHSLRDLTEPTLSDQIGVGVVEFDSFGYSGQKRGLRIA